MYVHGWSLPREIDTERWARLHRAASAALAAADRLIGARRYAVGLSDSGLRGPEGEGPLVVESDRIAFNGAAHDGHAGDAFLLERRPRGGVVRNPAVGDRVFRRCDTRELPYDVAVCAVLLVAAHILGDDLRLGSEGTLRSAGWRDATEIARQVLGTGDRLTQDDRGFLRWAPAAAHPRALWRNSA